MFYLLTIPVADEETRSVLMYELEGEGATGFEETDKDLLAYFKAEGFSGDKIATVISSHNLSFEKTELAETNWNALWESNFQPVFVDDFLYIRADFHEPSTGFEHELVITPKMSFGTGHHATTWLMVQTMRQLDFQGRSVFDFGTGTGILAILAARLGAERVWAIDNDSNSIENSGENVSRNAVNNIELALADTFTAVGEQFDIILANINKNVILDHLSALAARLRKDGTLLLSGLLGTDEDDIRLAASIHGLAIVERREKDNWLCLRATLSPQAPN